LLIEAQFLDLVIGLQAAEQILRQAQRPAFGGVILYRLRRGRRAERIGEILAIGFVAQVYRGHEICTSDIFILSCTAKQL
jgi:hypothetical protein